MCRNSPTDSNVTIIEPIARPLPSWRDFSASLDRFAEVVGANIAAGLLITVLGISGAIGKVMSLWPLPIVMGMVCAVFLPFELKIITGFEDNFFWIAFVIVTAFIVGSALPAVAKVAPPVLAALAAGIVAVDPPGLAPSLH